MPKYQHCQMTCAHSWDRLLLYSSLSSSRVLESRSKLLLFSGNVIIQDVMFFYCNLYVEFERRGKASDGNSGKGV